MTNYESNCVMSDLIGKTVKALYLSHDQADLFVLHNEGMAAYGCYGDCCSETWIADIVGVSGLLGHTVLEAQDIDLPDIQDERCRQEDDRFYGIKLLTTGGYVDIVYRNSSNGYYGGELLRETASEDLDVLELIEIKEDYSA